MRLIFCENGLRADNSKRGLFSSCPVFTSLISRAEGTMLPPSDGVLLIFFFFLQEKGKWWNKKRQMSKYSLLELFKKTFKGCFSRLCYELHFLQRPLTVLYWTGLDQTVLSNQTLASSPNHLSFNQEVTFDLWLKPAAGGSSILLE